MKKILLLICIFFIYSNSYLSQDKKTNYRKADHEILKIFTDRWSAYALSPNVSDEELYILFEAARWAPSAFNSQPWKFVYAKSTDKEWPKFLNLLDDYNKSWAKKAGALILVLSEKNFTKNNKFSKSHSFDTGAAVQNISLQAASMNLISHIIAGFDCDAARSEFNINQDLDIEVMIAIGKSDLKESLPKELQKKEEPSSRKKIEEFLFHGSFE